MKRLTLLGIFIFSICGCASVEQMVPFPDQKVKIENPQMCRIYVMRPAGYFGAAIPMSVKDGDKFIGDTSGASYLCWEREPGDVTISSKSENESWVKLSTVKGQVYYVLQRYEMGFVLARNKLEEVSAEEGLKYLAQCKPPKVKKQ